MKSQTDSNKLIQKLFTKEDLSHIPGIKWGISQEERARQQYIREKSQYHQNFKCTAAGLVINPSYPYLGASPDGFETCTWCGLGLIEIKCHFSIKEFHPDVLKNRKNSFLNAHRLITSHKYYTQVQGQLLITEKVYCDFIVWIPHGMKTQRIYQNFNFSEKLVRKLTNFYVGNMLPEIVKRLMQSSRNDHGCTSTSKPSNEDSLHELYCLCQQPEHGKMIMCEDPNCKYVWFHFTCVGIHRANKGKWFCPICIGKHSNKQ